MQKESGFTLIELIVTLTVAGILAAVAVPNFKTTIENNRLVTQSNDLLAAMLYARTQAISSGSTQAVISANIQNQYVTVCASSDGATCNSTNWANGWIVEAYISTPTAAPGAATSLGASTLTVIRAYPALPSGTTLNGGAYNSGSGSVQFAANGSLASNTTITGKSYFYLCDSRGVSYGRAIYLGASGEARVSTTVGKILDGVTAMPSC